MTDLLAATVMIQRLMPATPDEVYAEWLDPDSLLDWMCPRPARCVGVEADSRVGGRLRIDIDEHGKRFSVYGTYTALDRPNRIGFTWSCSTWPDPMLVTYVVVTLAAHGNNDTLMTITHTALTADLRQQHVVGWRLIAEQLDAALLTKHASSG